MPEPFYGPDQAIIHDREFGDLSRRAAAYLRPLLDEAGLRHGTVVDLGCGSGILASILTDAGYDVLGVDVSQDMIELASANAPKASFRRGSLLDVDLPPAVAVTAIGEALNYATAIGASPSSARSTNPAPAGIGEATNITCCGSMNPERSSTPSGAPDSRPRASIPTAHRPDRRRQAAGR